MAAVARSNRGPELKTSSTASVGKSPSDAGSSTAKSPAVRISAVEIDGIQPTYRLGIVDAPVEFAGDQALWKFGSAAAGVCVFPGLKGRLICGPLAGAGATGG